MKDLQKPGHVSLTSLIEWLRGGKFVIPDFQREFEWHPADIRELMISIFRDYYIGSLLIWKGNSRNFDMLTCEPIYGFQGGGEHQYIVLDGQQRLTAIYYACLAPDVPAPNRKNRFLFFIRVDQFMEGNYDEACVYDWTARGTNLLKNETMQFKKHMFPLSLVGESGWELGNWVQEYEGFWEKTRSKAESNCNKLDEETAARNRLNASEFGKILRGITQQYQVAYVELDVDLELTKICDIFSQINSRGIRLDIFDLLNALLRPKEIQLKSLWRKAKPKFDFFEADRMNVYVLQVISILCQNYCSPKYLYYLIPGQVKKVRNLKGSLSDEILIPTSSDFLDHWDNAIKALEYALNLLQNPQEFGVISSKYLPYFSIIPAFASLMKTVTNLPANRRLSAQQKVRHWYWASVFTNRYSGSVESTSARDFIEVKKWIESDDHEPSLIVEFRDQYTSLELEREERSGTSIFNGVFNLLVLREARDWYTGIVPRYDELDDHHIVPRSWINECPDNDVQIDTVLNRTLLSSETNRNVINDRLPNEYLQELIDKNGKETVKEMLSSHCISASAFEILLRTPFEGSDYCEFIKERKNTLIEAIYESMVKKN